MEKSLYDVIPNWQCIRGDLMYDIVVPDGALVMMSFLSLRMYVFPMSLHHQMERSTHQESVKNSAHGPTICLTPSKLAQYLKTSVKVLEMLKFVSKK